MMSRMLQCGVVALIALAGCSSGVDEQHDYLGDAASSDGATTGSNASGSVASTDGAPSTTGTTGAASNSGATSSGQVSGTNSTSTTSSTTGGFGTNDAGTTTMNATGTSDATTSTTDGSASSGSATAGATTTGNTMFGGVGGAGGAASASDTASVGNTTTSPTTSTTGESSGSDDCRLMLGDVPVCCTAVGDDRGDVDEVFELLNAYRTSLGLDALAHDPVLEEAIQGHCKHMSEADFFDHISPVAELETPWDRAEMCGTSANAENIAWGYRSPADVMEGWQNSPGHDQNMRTTGSSRVGIGKYGEYWGQIFGR